MRFIPNYGSQTSRQSFSALITRFIMHRCLQIQRFCNIRGSIAYCVSSFNVIGHMRQCEVELLIIHQIFNASFIAAPH